MKKLNNIISKDNTEYKFATMFLGYYDITTGNFTYANAGHLPTIHITDNQTIDKFGFLNNTALGLYSELKYNSGFKHIKQGEKIV